MLNASVLVQSLEANEFFDTFSLATARNAHLGRPDDFTNNVVRSGVKEANDSLAEGINLINRLAVDETKNDVLKHQAAERVANRVEAVLAASQAKLDQASDAAFLEGAEIVGGTLRLNADNAFRDDRLHTWMEQQAAKPEGIGIIRAAIQSDRDLASVLWTSKPYLLGINAETLGNLKMDAVKVHAPNAQALFDHAAVLQKTASRYPQLIRSMKASFFNNSVAAKASTQVDI